MNRGKAGRHAPRLTPSDIIAALLDERRPWAWRARVAAGGPAAAQVVDAGHLFVRAQLASVVPARPGVPRRTPRSR